MKPSLTTYPSMARLECFASSTVNIDTPFIVEKGQKAVDALWYGLRMVVEGTGCKYTRKTHHFDSDCLCVKAEMAGHGKFRRPSSHFSAAKNIFLIYKSDNGVS